jgi:predicted transcriptional regulator
MPGLQTPKKSTMKTDRQAQAWAVAILREDFKKTWREIEERMGCSEWKARYLYSRIKKQYKL